MKRWIAVGLLASLTMGAEIPFSNICEWSRNNSESEGYSNRGSSDLLSQARLIHGINRRNFVSNIPAASYGTAQFEVSDSLGRVLTAEQGNQIDSVLQKDEVHYLHYRADKATSVTATIASELANTISFRILKNGGFVRPWSRTNEGNWSRTADTTGLTIERIDTEVRAGDEFIIQVSGHVENPTAYGLILTGATFTSQFTARPTELARTEQRELQQRDRVEEYATRMGVPIDTILESGQKRTMVDVVNDTPRYYVTYNYDAAISTGTDKLWPNGDLNLDLTGKNLPRSIGIWDGGAVLTSHREFENRVTLGDNVATNEHSTHVAGTMVGVGLDSRAKGMAYDAELVSYDWNNDLSQMRTEAGNGLVISQHSYGMPDDYSYSSEWDAVAYDYPFYTISKSAANDGEKGSKTITLHGNSKNIITVGSAHDLPNGWQTPQITISNFSSRGPTPDFRIKPDIMANGQDVYSTSDKGDSEYTTMSGTSMSGPAHAGTVALLHEHYYMTHGNTFLRSASMRGLVIHTANEMDEPGPDYNSGWGYLNAPGAIEIISENDGGNLGRIQELSLQNNEEFSLPVDRTSEDVTVTICWNDPVPSASQSQGSTRKLVNDLDLRVYVDGTEYLPWAMNTQTSTALKGDNDRDNVEKIQISGVTGSNVEIRVSHKGSLDQAQDFSLLMTGVEESREPYLTVSSPNGGEQFEQYSEQKISWRSNVDEPVDIILLKGGSLSDTLAKSVSNSGSFNWQIPEDMVVGSDYKIVVAALTDTLRDTSDTQFSIVKEQLIANFPFIEDFDQYQSESEEVGIWEQSSDDDMNWLVLSGATPTKLHPQGGGTGPDMDHTGNSGNYIYTESTLNYGKQMVIATPQMNLTELLDPTLTFWIHMYSSDGTMGNFSLHAEVDGVLKKDIFTISGDQGDVWSEQSVDLSEYVGKRVKFIFDATTGSSYYSDICIDDINVDGVQMAEFTELPSITGKIGVNLSQRVALSPTGSVPKVTINSAPQWISLRETPRAIRLYGTAPEGSATTGTIILKRSIESYTAFDTLNYTLDQNHRPKFSQFADDTISVTEEFFINLTLSDDDVENSLSIEAETIPAWILFSDNGDGMATLSGTPQESDTGIYQLTIWGYDGVINEPEPLTFSLFVQSDITDISVDEIQMASQKGIYLLPTVANQGEVVSVFVSVKEYLNAEIIIFDNIGNRLFYREVITQPVNSSDDNSFVTTWDGRNERGDIVASGSYIVVVKVISEDGSNSLYKSHLGIKQ